MRLSRFLAGPLAVLLCVALVGNSPSQAVASADDPLATTVTGACTGGPGRLSLTAYPPAGGSFRVEITARGLVEGSRWAVQVEQLYAEGEPKYFRRVAVNGEWAVVTRFFPAPEFSERRHVKYLANARELGDRSHRCELSNEAPVDPPANRTHVEGVAPCNNPRRFVHLLVYELDDGSTLVRTALFDVGSNSLWHLTLTATGAASRQVVNFEDRAGGTGLLRSRVVLTGIANPRLRLMATRDGGRCFISVDPPTLTPMRR